jgi:hypothetical protein
MIEQAERKDYYSKAIYSMLVLSIKKLTDICLDAPHSDDLLIKKNQSKNQSSQMSY